MVGDTLSPGGVLAGWPKVDTTLSTNQRLCHVAWWGVWAVRGHLKRYPWCIVGRDTTSSLKAIITRWTPSGICWGKQRGREDLLPPEAVPPMTEELRRMLSIFSTSEPLFLGLGDGEGACCSSPVTMPKRGRRSMTQHVTLAVQPRMSASSTRFLEATSTDVARETTVQAACGDMTVHNPPEASTMYSSPGSASRCATCGLGSRTDLYDAL
mmetsp:Transcript_36515/g.91867  ORF Transcript_36515/g.91867 Transcript_36515/m.91867 type:complete len:211 (+) Transcript_36515:487-1119(+)